MKKTIIKSWNQITLQQFMTITEMQIAEPDAEKYTRKVIEYLYDIDPLQIPYTDYLTMIRGLNEFFSKPITELKISKNGEYIINDTCYILDINPASFTTAQYIDFTTFAKDGKFNYIDMLSAVLIPKGHIYNDGYDMDKTKSDLGSMPVDSALGIVGFFLKWSKASIKTILRFLTSKKRMKKVDRAKWKALQKEITRLCRVMESFHLS